MNREQREIPVFVQRMTSTTRGFAAPWRYIQGPGEFDRIGEYSKDYSSSVYVLMDSLLYDKLGNRLRESFNGTDTLLYLDKFGGECCQREIDRVTEEIKSRGAGLAIAIGGGKTLDTVKVAAIAQNIHLMIVPTSAANDAPVSALAVVYTETGAHDHSIVFNRGSDLVLVDSDIIMKSPRRLLVAGMGDALSTYFEACACSARRMKNAVGCLPCKVAMSIARLSFDILMEDSVKALIAQEAGVVNEAFENIVEVNVLMSGLGFQNTGCSMAHAINAGLSELPEAGAYLHGERVGFGVLVQLVFENRPMAEIHRIMDYLASVGLPMTLAQVGVEATPEKIGIMAEKMVYHNGLAHAQCDVLNKDTVEAAIRVADAMGHAYQNGQLFCG